MYKDVWKIAKKILSVVLSVALIIGVVEIAPKVKAMATSNNEEYYELTALEKESGSTVKLLVKVLNPSLKYNGSPQCPTIDGEVLLLGTDGTKTPITNENWYLTGAQTNALKESEPDYKCYLTGGVNYDITPDDSNAIPYRIEKAEIYDIFVERSNTNVVKWNPGGSAPELSSVKVELNGGIIIDLNSSQYEVVKASADSVGKLEATVNITDKNNFNLGDDGKSVSVSFKCGYDLGGSVAQKTSKYTMDLQKHEAPYNNGNKITPVVIIWDENNQIYNYTSSFFKTTYYNSEGNKVKDIKEAGTYTVSVTPSDGAHAFADSNGVYFTGEYRGTFTVGARKTNGLTIVAKDLNNNQHPEIWKNGEAGVQLVYPYDGGKPVELQEYSIWDGKTEVTDKFTISWENTYSVGTAYMVVTPKPASNYDKDEIVKVPYFITSELKVESLVFTKWGTYMGNNISIPYQGLDQPVAPSSVTVKTLANTTLTEGKTFTVAYAYQEGESWLPATGPDDPNLAFAGMKKVIVTGIAGYTGQMAEKEYRVAAVDMNDSEFKDKFKLTITDPGPFYYNGVEHKPSYTFTFNDVAVNPNDYREVWINNTNAGTATLKVEGTGRNFTGSTSATFKITAISLDHASIEGSPYTYNGSPISPKMVIKGGSYGAGFEYELKKNVDYEIIETNGNPYDGDLPKDANATPYTLRIQSKEGNKNIVGQSPDLSYIIDPKDIGTENSFTLQGVNGGEIEWNGGVMEPTLTGSLTPEEDYTFIYEDNRGVTPSTSSGAAVVITGKGNYTGELKLFFKITPRRFTTVSGGGFTFDATKGTDIIPDYTFTLNVKDDKRLSGEKDLKLGSDYTIKELSYYDDATEEWQEVTSGGGVTGYTLDSATNQIKGIKRAGKYKIKIRGINSYGGELETEVTCGTDISGYRTYIRDSSKRTYTYTGEDITPGAIELYGHREITSDCYEAAYERDVEEKELLRDVGTIYVVAVGVPEKGYYGRTLRSSLKGSFYQITPPSWSDGDFQVSIDTGGGISYLPNNGTRIPKITVSFGGVRLVEGEDYELPDRSGSEWKEAGDKEIHITGINNYQGNTWNETYNVAHVDISSADVEFNPGDTIYYGREKPTFTLKHKGYILREDEDYELVEKNPPVVEDAGKYQVTYTIRGKGNYTGTLTRTLDVELTNLETDRFTSKEDAQVGDFYVEWKPSKLVIENNTEPVMVTYSAFTIVYKNTVAGNGLTLTPGEDYEIIENGENDQAGQAERNYVMIRGNGGFAGTARLSVTLYADFEDAKPKSTSLVTEGAIISKQRWDDVYKTDGEDGLLKLERVFDDETGGVINPSEYDLKWDSGFNVADPAVGSYVLNVSGGQRADHYYYGNFDIHFTIVNGIDDAQITVNDDNSIEYDGTPAVVTKAGCKFVVKIGEVELKRDVDYEIVGYAHNEGIGDATVTLEGKGNYNGTIQHTYHVTYPLKDLVLYMQKDDGSEAYRVTADGSSRATYTYDGNPKTPSIIAYCPAESGKPYDYDFVSDPAMKALDISYYDVVYSANENAGTAYATVNPGTYITGTGARRCKFKIEQALIDPVSNAGIEYSKSSPISAEYNGDTYTAESLGIELSNRGKTMTDGTDYIVKYSGNLKDATKNSTSLPRVIFLGENNYTGKHEIEVRITEKSLNSSDIVAGKFETYYSGESIKDDLTRDMKVTMNTNYRLAYGTDFEIEGFYWDSNGQEPLGTADGVVSTGGIYYPTKPETYYAKIRGKGNFKDTRYVTVEIKKRPMDQELRIEFIKRSENASGGAIVIDEPDCIYNGEEFRPEFRVIYGKTELLGSDYTFEYTNNTDVGTATLTVTAAPDSNYEGTVSRDFTIRQKDISTDDIVCSTIKENYPFTGESVEPDIIEPMTVTYYRESGGNLPLNKGTDYTVDYQSENDLEEIADQKAPHSYAGKVTMTVKGTGNYTGEKKFEFYIGEDISQAYATLINSSTTYNGLKQGPKEEEITVIANGAKLDDAGGEKCYNIAYYKNGIEKENEVALEEIVDAATYYVAVIGIPSKGTYAKTPADKCTYTIHPKSIANCNVSGFEGMYYYTGKAICPTGIVVTDTDLPVDESGRKDTRSVQLQVGTDYTVDYSDNISAGKATIVVSGTGNYTGKVYGYFTIDGSNVSGNKIDDGTSEGTGSLSDGTTTISAEDIDLYYGNSQYNFMLYNGGHIRPSIRVANGNIDANNFILTSSNDVNPGVATLTITGDGNNYTGTIVKNYIIKANLATYGRIVPVEDQVYTGSYVTPNVTVTCGNSVLIPGKDYQATYANNVNVGVATVQAQGLASSYYFGTATGTFNISNRAGGMEITGYASNYTYTGYAITPEVIVTMDGRLLNRGTDYQVSYSNNINVGNATMTVTGIGSYSGTKVIPFTIQAKNIENCLTTTVNNYSYNGSTYTPNITVTDSTNGKTLVAGTDYTVTYSNNTNPGTASITVTALSRNYTGSKVIPFKIKSAPVSGLRTSTIKNNSIKLVWTAQSYADGYQICNSNNRVIAMTSNNKFTIKNLKSYTTYKYKVRSYVENSDGSVAYGNFSSAVSAKTLLNTPTLSAKSNSRGKVTLTWSKVSKATGYEIYYSTKRDGIYTKLKTVSKNSARKFVDAGLASGEKYYYTIRAYRKNNGVKTYSSYNTIRAVRVK